MAQQAPVPVIKEIIDAKGAQDVSGTAAAAKRSRSRGRAFRATRACCCNAKQGVVAQPGPDAEQGSSYYLATGRMRCCEDSRPSQVLEENCAHFAILLAPEGTHTKEQVNE